MPQSHPENLNNFKYKKVLLNGRPVHDDDFMLRHPPMSMAKRAKIFSPFDALEGFSDAIARRERDYEDRRTLSWEESWRLGRQLEKLQSLTRTRRLASQNAISVSCEYFVPCRDPQHPAYGKQGSYHIVSGIVRKVDLTVGRSITIDDMVILFEDIRRLYGPRTGAFAGIFEDI